MLEGGLDIAEIGVCIVGVLLHVGLLVVFDEDATRRERTLPVLFIFTFHYTTSLIQPTTSNNYRKSLLPGVRDLSGVH